MEKTYGALYDCPIGCIEIKGTEQGIVSVDFLDTPRTVSSKIPDCLKSCVRQIDEYFKGARRDFTLGLVLQGTAFQMRVWSALRKIPYGQTASYRDIARAIGNEKAVRAVGNANGRNRIPIIIPCHRVIGSSGDLVGFASGLWRKEWLLNHERGA